jgi:uncharacterized protein (TIGR02147 family)
MSKRLRIHTSRLSQVFRGPLHLMPEQAYGVAEYLGLTAKETRYFVLLVERERAGTKALREFFNQMLLEIRREAQQVSSVVPREPKSELDPVARSIFYSSWTYPALSLLCDIPQFQTPEAMAKALGLSRESVARHLEFLAEHGLVRHESGRYTMGTSSTHLEAGSPLISHHHMNWRARAMQRYSTLSNDELAYSGPMVLSEADFRKIRQKILDLVKDITHTAVASKSEKLVCLGIDWFQV